MIDFSIKELMDSIHFIDSEDDSSDTDLNDADIESMLNERLPDELKNKKVEAQYDEKFKTVLEGEVSLNYV